MSAGWRQQRERGSQALVRFMCWLASRVGRPPARLLLYPITAYFVLTSPVARRASRDFLSRVHGRRAGPLAIFRHLHTFAAVILDRVYFLMGDTDRFDVRVHGYEQVMEAVGGRGMVLLGSHLGSFDAVRCMGMKGYGLRLKVHMQHEHNQFITRLLESLNPEVAASVIPVGGPDSMLRTSEWLDEGGSVGMLGDRVASVRRSCRCEFLGGEALFPTGPWWLARRLGVPVVLFFGLYRGGRRYDIHLQVMDQEGGDHGLCHTVQAYAEILEGYARDAPDNWFNFYDFWDEGVSGTVAHGAGGPVAPDKRGGG